MLCPRVCFLEKSSFTHTLMVGLPFGSISFPLLLTPEQTADFHDASLLTPVFMSRQLSLWAVDGLQCHSSAFTHFSSI